MAGILIRIIDLVYWAVFILVFARFLLSWVNIGSYEIREWVFRLTEPMLAPIRRLLPATAGLDFSPMILLLGIYILRTFLVRLLI